MNGEEIGLATVAGAVLGASAVYVGEAMQWPGFNIRAGYWGTSFLRSVLYAVGDDRIVIAIVAAIWAVYGAVLVNAITLLVLRGGVPKG